jgi:ferric-dicitrate binding protein FerR (iron transport regulator)
MRPSIVSLGAAVAAAALFSMSAAAQTEQRIGAAAAVRNQVTGTRVEGQARPLSVGAPVFQNEQITTGSNSVAQLLFTDQTTLSIGQRSQVTLDRYVYDGNRSGGDVAVSLGSGAMRFITGSQEPRNYQVRTPVATIGVRGTIVDLLVLDGRMFGILDEGRVIFTLANGQTIELNRPGTAIEFFSDGTTSRPFTWRGRYEQAFSTATFPLFGNPFADFPGFEGAYDADDPTNRTDDLNASFTQASD